MSEGNGYVTRDDILAPSVRRFDDVEVPGWGKFRIRSLTELERSRFEASIRDKKGQVSNNRLIDLKCRLIVLCVVDGNGNQLLTHSDIERLHGRDSRDTNTLADGIQKHVGISDSDLEDMEKNSAPTAAAK